MRLCAYLRVYERIVTPPVLEAKQSSSILMYVFYSVPVIECVVAVVGVVVRASSKSIFM